MKNLTFIKNKARRLKDTKSIFLFLKLLLVLGSLVLLLMNRHIFFDFGTIDTTANFSAEGFSEPITKDQPIQIFFRVSHHKTHQILFRFADLENMRGTDTSDFLCELRDAKENVLQSVQFTSEDIGEQNDAVFHISSELKKGQIYHIVLSSDQSSPQNAYRLNFGSAMATDVVQWNQGNRPMSSTPAFNVLYNHFSFVYFFIILACLIGAIACIFLPSLPSRGLKLAYHTSLFLFTPASILYVIEKLNQASSISSLGLKTLLFNYFILFTLYLIVYAITNRLSISLVFTSTILLLFAIINHFVLIFRTTTFLPGDIYGFETALNVMSNYYFEVTAPLLQAVVIWVFLFCAATRDRLILKNGKSRIRTASLTAILSCTAIFSVSLPSIYNTVDIRLNWWNQTESGKENGFIANFAINIPALFTSPPSGYQANDIMHLVQTQEISSSDESLYPHLFVIMNESFADLSIAGEIKTNQNPWQFLHELAEDDDPRTFVGNVVVPIYGANTNCSEFEMLTGFSLVFNNSIAPYSQFVRREIPSVASRLKVLGYDTIFSHPGDPASWDRNKTTPLLGFDQNYFQSDFGEIDYISGFASDTSSYNFIVDQFENRNSAPQFHYNLTIQNHGGYGSGGLPEMDITLSDASDDYPDVEEYLSLLSYSDEALKDLFSYFESVDEPVLILMFGDHWGAVNEDYLSSLFETDISVLTRRQMLTLHSTPLVLWANFDVDFSEIPEYISSNYLSILLSNTAKLPLTPFEEFLLQCMEQYPVISFYGCIDKDGNYMHELPPEAEELKKAYSYLQYNGLFDYKKRANIF